MCCCSAVITHVCVCHCVLVELSSRLGQRGAAVWRLPDTVSFHFFSHLCRQHSLKKLVPETCASRLVQETCTCVGQSCRLQVFWYKFLAHNWTQLYSSTETVRHVTRTVQRDWPESCILARNCDELVSNFSCVCYKFLYTISEVIHYQTVCSLDDVVTVSDPHPTHCSLKDVLPLVISHSWVCTIFSQASQQVTITRSQRVPHHQLSLGPVYRHTSSQRPSHWWVMSSLRHNDLTQLILPARIKSNLSYVC